MTICWEIILAHFFFYRFFRLRKTCEETFWDFLQDCSLIPSSMKWDSCGIWVEQLKNLLNKILLKTVRKTPIEVIPPIGPGPTRDLKN